jgi:di/tricarboxylate transporter
MSIREFALSIPAERAALSLIVFGTASALWTFARLNATLVGLAAAGILVAAGAVPPADLAGIATSDIIRLMIGAFVLGEAIIVSGLATRLTSLILAQARRVDQLFWLTAAAMALLTFLVPSTSGRGAVALPLFRALSGELDEAAVRGLALLIPTIVLTTTIAALTGAGSHLIANDMLHAAGLDPVGYGAWALNGLPLRPGGRRALHRRSNHLDADAGGAACGPRAAPHPRSARGQMRSTASHPLPGPWCCSG